PPALTSRTSCEHRGSFGTSVSKRNAVDQFTRAIKRQRATFPERRSPLLNASPTKAWLRQNPANHTPLHQLARLVEVVVHDRLGVDADAVVDRRQQVLRVDRVLQRRRGGAVRTPVDEAAADAGAGDAGGVAVRPVVTAV